MTSNYDRREPGPQSLGRPDRSHGEEARSNVQAVERLAGDRSMARAEGELGGERELLAEVAPAESFEVVRGERPRDRR